MTSDSFKKRFLPLGTMLYRVALELLMVNKDGSAVSSIYFKKDRNDGSAILFVTKERTLVSVVYIKGRFSTRDLMTTFSRFK